MSNLVSVFQSKYDEFVDDLLSTFPELAAELAAAKALTPPERLTRYQTEVLPSAAPNRDATACPGTVLPGVTISEALWAELSDKSRGAIQEYLTLLTVCCLLELNGGKDMEGMFGGAGMNEFLNTWKSRMASVDFNSMAEKLAGIFGMKDGMPNLPEKFLRGHLARLAEELVRDFNPEDFGLDAETMKACENDPGQAFAMLMKVYGSNPAMITNTISKIGKRLQAKMASGEIRPQEIVAEAEELMKTFSENPAFVEMMETFRSLFGMEDMDVARSAGREGSARMAIVRERLRKKMEAKRAATGAGGPVAAQNTITPPSASGAGAGAGPKKKGKGKK